jgi:hypothetical protein
MKRTSLLVAFLTGLLLVLALATPRFVLGKSVEPVSSPQTALTFPVQSPLPSSRLIAEADTSDPELPKNFDQVVKGMQRMEGLFPIYRDRSSGKVYAELKPNQLSTFFLCTVTLESGLGQRGVYSGFPLADYVFYFRRVENKIQFVVPNVNFRARADDPLLRSIQNSFTSSVLQALPIKAYHPKRQSYLIDLGNLFLSDLPGLTQMLPLLLGTAYTLDTSKTYFDSVKPFPLNLELASVYGFNGEPKEGSEVPFLDAVPDDRTFSLKVRYSLSQLPSNNGYTPRKADDRVGYFITAYQNLSDNSSRTPFTRYINRWHLEKQDPTAPLSPPKKPIVFWIENTVPLEYRDTVREGVLLWNKAFEKIGFKDAIQVQQMPDRAGWDPADIRYNTIRWISSFEMGFLGLGPPRVNPLTGEILDADVLIDSSVVRFMNERYRTLAQQNQMKVMPALAKLTGNPDLCGYGTASQYLRRSQPAQPTNARLTLQLLSGYDLCFSMEATHQLTVGSMAMTMLQDISPDSAEMKRYVKEFVRMLVAHEIGHTLGLRHNFRASAMLTPAELNNREITQKRGLIGSVMDYSAVNLAPQGTPQGDYFTQTVGAYDEWAIAYGYTPTGITPAQTEAQFLQNTARRAPEPDLAYATDEDTLAGLDPLVNRFDLSSDLLTYAPWQLENARQMWQRLDQRYPATGGSYSDVRMMFDEIFDYYFQYTRFLTAYIGGQSFNRFRNGDAEGRLPFEPVPLEKQKQAFSLLQKYAFDETMFHFSASFLQKLAPSRWSHWGENPELRSLDYPIHDRILYLQAAILGELLDYDRLARLRDADLKGQTEQSFTLPELLEGLQTTIWREVLQPPERLQLSSLRRGLQRVYLDTMTRIVLRQVTVPDDARTLAWYNLKQLYTSVDGVLGRKDKLDISTRAHLEETRDRIAKTLNAQLQTQ